VDRSLDDIACSTKVVIADIQAYGRSTGMRGNMATSQFDPVADPPDAHRRTVVSLEITRERPSADDAIRDQQWVDRAACRGHHELFFAARSERPQARTRRESQARQMCENCPVIEPCRATARRLGEYGFWGGESEEERAAAGFRVDMPVGRVARYPKGNGTPVEPRTPRVA
jgi:WhiB family redox-sensing transcriptional regulator